MGIRCAGHRPRQGRRRIKPRRTRRECGMAKKPFYSMEEVCAQLGKTEDDIKSLVRAGELREFRDAGKVFFKAEDIEKLAGGAEADASDDTGEILLEGMEDAESRGGGDEVPTLVESSGGTSIIGLEPLEDEESPSK